MHPNNNNYSSALATPAGSTSAGSTSAGSPSAGSTSATPASSSATACPATALHVNQMRGLVFSRVVKGCGHQPRRQLVGNCLQARGSRRFGPTDQAPDINRSE